jgi:hypothetical protein
MCEIQKKRAHENVIVAIAKGLKTENASAADNNPFRPFVGKLKKN